MTRVQFSIGQGYTFAGAPLDALHARKDRAYRYIAGLFGGFNASSNDGGWIDKAGKLVLEPDLSITTVIQPDKLYLVDSAALFLADVFSQASVLITLDDVTARFSDASSHVETLKSKGDTQHAN